ncbi:hypothetical protein HALDL1_01285 (plasmid) [Halobacterium sp. DL1]|nr:hypothetical protein HALDL1_01285 [Halobacterium sp. DL1]
MEDRQLENRVECFVAWLVDENAFVGDGSDDDELCPLHARHTRRDELGTDLFVSEFDECALDK